ncbi:hypothetical protein M440DRAFT_1222221 [Trichoderma longibrachiatum ATCC 18648]|uniref:Uncharacterized protein n=1 Tax=Trichoderma longibrachiatum ATCC 18648 TaxID=983965 RepID=A0A2T4C886_TRILO|nr:hypothetical protein M440DRAFT_1222221 [Trichoderma longibrachiatum ATCC 18648]
MTFSARQSCMCGSCVIPLPRLGPPNRSKGKSSQGTASFPLADAQSDLAYSGSSDSAGYPDPASVPIRPQRSLPPAFRPSGAEMAYLTKASSRSCRTCQTSQTPSISSRGLSGTVCSVEQNDVNSIDWPSSIPGPD